MCLDWRVDVLRHLEVMIESDLFREVAAILCASNC